MDHENRGYEVWKDNTECVCLRSSRESIAGIHPPEDTRCIYRFSGHRQAYSRGEFTASDGSIFGRHLELVKGKKIVQEWTTTEWPENYPASILTLIFQSKRNGTLLTMVHSRVPACQTSQCSSGWKEYYRTSLKTYFSRLKKKSVNT